MQEKFQKKSVSPEEVAEIRKNLRRGDNVLIAEMLDGLYKPITIQRMIIGERKMKPIVLEAANRLIETIDKLKSTSNESAR